MNLKNMLSSFKDGGEVGGSVAQFPLTTGGTPSQSSEKQWTANRAVSRLIWSLEAKTVEDIEKQEVRGLCWEGLWDLQEDQGCCSPWPGTYGRILGWEPDQQLPPIPNREDRAVLVCTWNLGVVGGNKDEVGDAHRQCLPMRTMDTG